MNLKNYISPKGISYIIPNNNSVIIISETGEEMQKISIVIPVFNSEKTIGLVVNSIIKLYVDRYDLEIILVNDCSRDGSYQVCKDLASNDQHVICVNLSRNFGQHSAIMAGLTICTGDYIILMDDDMQNPPEEAILLLNKIEEGFDVVFGARKNYQQNIIRKLGSNLNNFMFEMMVNKEKNLLLSNFLIMRKYVKDQIIKYDGPYPYIQGLILRITRNATSIFTEHKKRQVGKSNYNFLKIAEMWFNILTNFSITPLRISILLGTFFAMVGFTVSLILFIRKFITPNIQLGWTSLMVTIIFFSGIQLISIGMLGEYIGRIFTFQSKSPQYVIKEVVNLKRNEVIKETKDMQ